MPDIKTDNAETGEDVLKQFEKEIEKVKSIVPKKPSVEINNMEPLTDEDFDKQFDEIGEALETLSNPSRQVQQMQSNEPAQQPPAQIKQNLQDRKVPPIISPKPITKSQSQAVAQQNTAAQQPLREGEPNPQEYKIKSENGVVLNGYLQNYDANTNEKPFTEWPKRFENMKNAHSTLQSHMQKAEGIINKPSPQYDEWRHTFQQLEQNYSQASMSANNYINKSNNLIRTDYTTDQVKQMFENFSKASDQQKEGLAKPLNEYIINALNHNSKAIHDSLETPHFQEQHKKLLEESKTVPSHIAGMQQTQSNSPAQNTPQQAQSQNRGSENRQAQQSAQNTSQQSSNYIPQQSQNTQAKKPSKGLPWKKMGIGFGVALVAGAVFGGPIGVAAVLGCAALAGTGYGIYKATKAITAIGDARQQKSLENNDQKTSKKVQALDKALGKDLERQQKAELRTEFGKLRTEYNKNIQLLNALNKENNADINADRKSKDEVKKPKALKGIGSDHQKQVNKASIESLHAMRDSLQSNLETVKASVDKASVQLGSERVEKIKANLTERQPMKNKEVGLPGEEKAASQKVETAASVKAPQQGNANTPAPAIPKVLSANNLKGTQNVGLQRSHSSPNMTTERVQTIGQLPTAPVVGGEAPAKPQSKEKPSLGK